MTAIHYKILDVNLYGGIDMDTMQGLKRTHYCGDVEGIGNEVVVGGYVQKVRDLGNLIFSGLSGKYKERQ